MSKATLWTLFSVGMFSAWGHWWGSNGGAHITAVWHSLVFGLITALVVGVVLFLVRKL